MMQTGLASLTEGTQSPSWSGREQEQKKICDLLEIQSQELGTACEGHSDP